MKRVYTVVVPRADRTGPTNLAVQLADSAVRRGWKARLLYLSGSPSRDDLQHFCEVRKLKLTDLCRTEGVVHTHGLRPDVVGGIFALFRRCTVVTTLHGQMPSHLGFDYSRCKVQMGWWIWSAALRLFDRRICISNTMLRYYRRQFPRWRFDLAYNSRAVGKPSVTNLVPAVAAWMDSERKLGRIVLVYVGSLNARKNVLSLVRAVLETKDFALLVCGQGPQMSEITSELQARNGDRRVMLAGQVIDPETYVARADLLVLPSHAEGLPLVILEAASLGVPSLLSDIAVHRELARMGLGKTFRRHDFRDFADKARELAAERDPGSDAARRIVWSQMFAPDKGFEKYESIVLDSQD